MANPEFGAGHALRGPVDRGALIDFRDEFDRLEPLASATLDDHLNPARLHITLDDGIGETDTARLDVVWTTLDDYAIHYTDDAPCNLRWDAHPNDYPAVPGDELFHPPPDASNEPEEVEESCITVSEIVLVARAVHKLWRHAYDRGSVIGINAFVNPP